MNSALAKVLSATQQIRPNDDASGPQYEQPAYASNGFPDASSGYPYASASQGASGYQHIVQYYKPNARPPEANGSHGGQGAPDIVIRPPSAAPSRADRNGYVPAAHQSSYEQPRMQTAHTDTRSRAAPSASAQLAAFLQSTAPVAPSSGNHADPETYKPATTPHSKQPSNDLAARFPLREDAAPSRPSASSVPQGASASPKRGLTYPGASAPPPTHTVHVNPSNYHSSGAYDPRSPKPPSVATITQDTVASRQHPQSGSPGMVGVAVSAGSSSTPKHSPSARLHSHRNGSNDTIPHAVHTKHSPSGSSQQHLPHRQSSTSLQPPASRYDPVTNSRQVNPAYPEQARYRSPAPQGYPNSHAPSSTHNVAASIHSPAYSTQTPLSYDAQYSRTAAAPGYSSQHAQAASSQLQTRAGQSSEFGVRLADPSQIAPVSNTMPMSVPRAPSRSAPSPAPTVRPPRLATVSSPTSKVPPPLHSAPPRNQSFPTGGPSYSTITPSSHSRTTSDPQYGGSRAYASASLPSRSYAPPRKAPSPAGDILLTPSSLAPSMLPQTSAPIVPLTRQTSKSSTLKEKDGKKKFFSFNLFRSRSSPPKEREVDEPPPVASATVPEKRERQLSQPTQPPAQYRARPPSRAHVTSAVAATVSVPVMGQEPASMASMARIAAPTPVHATNGRTPTSTGTGKMFTPFRLLSRRHRTVSTASMDAVNGTVVSASTRPLFLYLHPPPA